MRKIILTLSRLCASLTGQPRARTVRSTIRANQNGEFSHERLHVRISFTRFLCERLLQPLNGATSFPDLWQASGGVFKVA
jgi:hypothetical protein